MFHPVCVGLMEGPDYNGFDFYCADCAPPPGKENVQMPPPLTRKKPSVDKSNVENISAKSKLHSSKGPLSATITPSNNIEESSHLNTSKLVEPQISITPTNSSKPSSRWPQSKATPPQATLSKSKAAKRPFSSVDVSPITPDSRHGARPSKMNSIMGGSTTLTPVSKAQGNAKTDEHAVSGNKKVTPIRPVEAQTVINIGGIKYLVVPHPTGSESKNETKQNDQRTKKKSKSPLPGSSEEGSLMSRLPFLLKPAVDSVHGEMGESQGANGPPTFEIEEMSDGRLILIPKSGGGSKNIPGCMMRSKDLPLKSDEDGETNDTCKEMKKGSVNYGEFTNNLSGGYFAMLNIFRYLNPQERTKVRRVCKLWKDIVQHQSLWEIVSLRNCRIHNWKSFAEFITKTQTKCLDVRKILHAQEKEPTAVPLSLLERQTLTWNRFAEAAPLMTNLQKLEMPKIRISELQKIIIGLTDSQQSKLLSIVATSIVTASSSNTDTNSKEINNTLRLETFARVRSLQEIKLRAASGPLHISNFEADLGLMAINLSTSLKRLSLLSIGTGVSYKQFEIIAQFKNLESLEIGDCSRQGAANAQTVPINKLISLKKLVHLRIERGEIGREVGSLEMLSSLDRLELIDTELKQGFSEGFIRLRKLKQLLLIPSYKDEVAAVNSEIVDSVLSMAELNLFILGLTNEWLESMNTLLQATSASIGKEGSAPRQPTRDSFPILVNGVCEMFSLKKLYKTLTDALPSAQVKILKMPQSATIKQSILGRKP